MQIPQGSVSAEDKRAALETVLASRTFERSEQLRAFLRYICETEIAGRAAEISEYSIGVEALGRPPDFSPAEDSSVRNRAHALRKRLDEFYASEAPPGLLRIELPKGSYTPRFLHGTSEDSEAQSAHPPTGTAPVRSRDLRTPAAAFLAGMLLAAITLWLANRDRLRAAPSTPVERVWQGMLQPGGTVLVSVATPPQSFIRPFPVPDPKLPGVMPVEETVQKWYRRMRPGPMPHLGQIPTFNSPLWGDAAGAVTVTGFLNRLGVQTELLAERLVTTPVFRNRNAVFLGNSEYSPIIDRLLRGLPLQVGYDQASGEHIVYETDEQGRTVRRFVPVRDDTSLLAQVHGLITILPAEGDGNHAARYIIVSGVTSAGTQAAAEFLVSPSHLGELLNRTGGRLPTRIQVLVRASTNRTVALSFGLETYRVIRQGQPQR